MIRQVEQTSIQGDIIKYWWHNAVRENRLFIRLIHEDIKQLAKLSYLETIIHLISDGRKYVIETDYPPIVETIRFHILSALRYFIECLRALITKDPIEGQMLHNLAHAEISMLQYIFMQYRIKSYL